jgi:hypothetical protein
MKFINEIPISMKNKYYKEFPQKVNTEEIIDKTLKEYSLKIMNEYFIVIRSKGKYLRFEEFYIEKS